MMMKVNLKKVIGFCVAIVALGLVVYTNIQNQKALHNTGKKNVYAVLPLSGSMADSGNAMKDMIVQWQKRHPDALFNIQFVDSQTRPDVAISALNQATLYDDNPIVLTALTLIANVLSPVVKQKNGFAFGTITLPLKQNIGSYQRVSNSIDDYMPQLVQYLQKSSSLAIIYTEDDYGVLASTELSSRYTANGGKITNKIGLDLKQRDVRIEIEKILQNKPGAVAVLGMPTLGYINAIKELKIRGYKGLIVGDYTLALPYIQKALEGYMEDNYFFILHPLPEREKEIMSAVNDANTVFYHIPAELWDVLDIINYTIEHNLSFNQETYTRMGKWKGVAGDVVFPGNGDSLYPFILVQYINGQFVPVKEKEKD